MKDPRTILNQLNVPAGVVHQVFLWGGDRLLEAIVFHLMERSKHDSRLGNSDMLELLALKVCQRPGPILETLDLDDHVSVPADAELEDDF